MLAIFISVSLLAKDFHERVHMIAVHAKLFSSKKNDKMCLDAFYSHLSI
jgi:hypothetical protein